MVSVGQELFKNFMQINSFNSHYNTKKWVLLLPLHYTDEKTED
jgi:hypothetical protein